MASPRTRKNAGVFSTTAAILGDLIKWKSGLFTGISSVFPNSTSNFWTWVLSLFCREALSSRKGAEESDGMSGKTAGEAAAEEEREKQEIKTPEIIRAKREGNRFSFAAFRRSGIVLSSASRHDRRNDKVRLFDNNFLSVLA